MALLPERHARLNRKQAMKYAAINLNDKFGKFDERWSPRVIAAMNDYQFKLVKVQGEFIWHSHPDTDEVFIVIDGALDIEFRDVRVSIGAGEMYVVPKGVEHKPVAEQECRLMLVEPRGTVNTGDIHSVLTAQNDVWV
jgi:mannose-6-phosphate isomerase-like protein (cupin superfamily)